VGFNTGINLYTSESVYKTSPQHRHLARHAWLSLMLDFAHTRVRMPLIHPHSHSLLLQRKLYTDPSKGKLATYLQSWVPSALTFNVNIDIILGSSPAGLDWLFSINLRIQVKNVFNRQTTPGRDYCLTQAEWMDGSCAVRKAPSAVPARKSSSSSVEDVELDDDGQEEVEKEPEEEPNRECPRAYAFKSPEPRTFDIEMAANFALGGMQFEVVVRREAQKNLGAAQAAAASTAAGVHTCSKTQADLTAQRTWDANRRASQGDGVTSSGSTVRSGVQGVREWMVLLRLPTLRLKDIFCLVNGGNPNIAKAGSQLGSDATDTSCDAIMNDVFGDAAIIMGPLLSLGITAKKTTAADVGRTGFSKSTSGAKLGAYVAWFFNSKKVRGAAFLCILVCLSWVTRGDLL